MARFLILSALAVVAFASLGPAALADHQAHASAKCHAHAMLPDTQCTPGATDPHVKQSNIQTTICKSGYTKTVRPPTSVTNPIKAGREIAYGIPGPLHPKPFRLEELDHLIPLELGGAPEALANLWPEPAPAYHTKDQLETKLKRLVCAGSLKLRTAQQAIARNWKTAYAKYVKA